MTYIIAEAGVNHNGSANLAKKLVNAAKIAGADAVKFQVFKTDNLVTRSATLANYQKKNLDVSTTQYNLLKNLELSYDSFIDIKRYCDDLNIDFLATAFDFESLKFLHSDLKIQKFKIASGDLTNLPFLLEHAKLNGELIISTGMSTFEEIKQALDTVAFGLLNPDARPNSFAEISGTFDLVEAKKVVKEKVTLLHCTTAYPTPAEDINLKAIIELSSKFGVDVGLSDHSQGIYAGVVATAFDIKILEKHLTLDKTMAGPDHKASLEPSEFRELVFNVKCAKVALGGSQKVPAESELENLNICRKFIVARKNIKKNELFNQSNIDIKRSSIGMHPSKFWDLLGTPASRSYSTGTTIDE